MPMEPLASTGPRPAATAGDRNHLGLADSFDSFLKLLTTQLTNQDPLAPLDANQFTQQLVQFTGVEQAIKTNGMLADLVALVGATQLSSGIEYLGSEVVARGDAVRLSDAGQARFQYRLSEPAAAVAINIRDEGGRLVHATVGAATAGSHAIAWDGRDAAGRRLPPGLYTAEVLAVDREGRPVPVQTTVAGTVDGVELQGGRLLLSVEGVLVEARSVEAIRRPAGAAA